MDRDILESVAAIKVRKFHDKDTFHDVSFEFFDKFDRGFHGPTGCKQIIYKKDFHLWVDGILVDFNSVSSIFKGVFLCVTFCRDLSWFSDGDKPCSKKIGKGCTENESS
jgi:hypothetical protein